MQMRPPQIILNQQGLTYHCQALPMRRNSKWIRRCKCARAFNQEHDLPIGSSNVGVTVLRTIEYRHMIVQELDELCDAANEKNWGFGVGGCAGLGVQLGPRSQTGNGYVRCLLSEACRQHEEKLLHQDKANIISLSLVLLRL